jgi:hypothetical protein
MVEFDGHGKGYETDLQSFIRSKEQDRGDRSCRGSQRGSDLRRIFEGRVRRIQEAGRKVFATIPRKDTLKHPRSFFASTFGSRETEPTQSQEIYLRVLCDEIL